MDISHTWVGVGGVSVLIADRSITHSGQEVATRIDGQPQTADLQLSGGSCDGEAGWGLD